MTKQMLTAWKSWWTRPLAMCLILMLIGWGLVVATFFLDDSNVISDATLSEEFSYLNWLDHEDQLPELLNSNQPIETITAVDLSFLLDDGNLLLARSPDRQRERLPIADHQRFLTRFPNLEYLKSDGDDLLNINDDVLQSLHNLHWVEISPFEVTNDHLAQLAQLPAIEHLEIHCSYSSADLSLLADIPTLRSLRIRDNWSRHQPNANPTPILSMQTLEQISMVEQLELLTLNFDLSHGDGLVRGDDDLTRLAATFRDMSGLQRLLIGSTWREQERSILRELRRELPGISVLPARVSGRLMPALVSPVFPLMVAVFIICMQLIAQFSGPASLLLPGHRSAHRNVFAILSLIVLTLTFLMEIGFGIHPLPAAAVTLAMIGMLSWFGSAHWNRQSVYELRRYRVLAMIFRGLAGLSIFVVIMFGLTFLRNYQPQLDWFMAGEQPVPAAVIVCLATPLILRSCQSFLNLQRAWAEAGVSPAVTVQQFSQSMQQYQQQFAEDTQRLANSVQGDAAGSTRTFRRYAKWSRSLQCCQDQLQSQAGSIRTFLAEMKRRSLGNGPHVVVGGQISVMVMAIYMVTFPALFGVYLETSATFTESVLSHQYMFGFMFYFVPFMAGSLAYARFPVYSQELLQPVTRHQWVGQVLGHIWWHTTTCCLTLWITFAGLRWLCGEPVSFPWMIVQLAAVGTFAVWTSNLIGLAIGVRRIWCTALTLAMGFIVLLGLIPVLGSGRLPSAFAEDLNDGQLFGPAVGTALIMTCLAVGVLTRESVRRYWLRMELVR